METNSLSSLGYKPGEWDEELKKIERTVSWTEPGLEITRLRLLSDPGFPYWDVSYCHGKLPDGTLVRVQLPFSQIPKRNFWKFIVKYVADEKDRGRKPAWIDQGVISKLN